MRILITGACGFVGSALAESLLERIEGLRVTGVDNLMRPGAESNLQGRNPFGFRVSICSAPRLGLPVWSLGRIRLGLGFPALEIRLLFNFRNLNVRLVLDAGLGGLPFYLRAQESA